MSALFSLELYGTGRGTVKDGGVGFGLESESSKARCREKASIQSRASNRLALPRLAQSLNEKPTEQRRNMDFFSSFLMKFIVDIIFSPELRLGKNDPLIR